MLGRFLAGLLILFSLISCATREYSPPRYKASKVKYGKPYVIRGKKYYPYKKVSYFTQVGIASWYGREEHGKLTASGEKFNMYDMTAAHKLLPLGSVVHVKNLENGKDVVVRINDRGPFVSGRIIDLSYAAAKKIGIVGKGTAKVKITLLSENPNYYQLNGKKVDLNHGNFAIQIGAFKVYKNALNLKNRYSNAKIVTAYVNGERFYRVWFTGFRDLDKAMNYLKKLKYKYPGAFVVTAE